MTKYLALKTLFFFNKVQFITRGRKHSVSDYLFLKCVAELNTDLKLKDVDGNTVSISNDKNDEYHYDNILVDYETFKLNRIKEDKK